MKLPKFKEWIIREVENCLNYKELKNILKFFMESAEEKYSKNHKHYLTTWRRNEKDKDNKKTH